MKINRAKKAELANKLTEIASNVAKKPVFVISAAHGSYDIVNYYNKKIVVENVPSKSLAVFMCDAFNKKQSTSFSILQNYVNIYAKHYYDCEFYKHTIKTTKDGFKRAVTINRLDISIEYLKQAAAYIRKSC